MAKLYRDSQNSYERAAAFVLMIVTENSEQQVIEDARAIGSVKEAYLCFGIYDLILKVETNSMDELKDLLAHKCRTIKNVKSVLTLILTEKNFKLKPFLNYTFNNNSKNKEIVYDEKNIQNFISSNLINN